MSITEGLPEEVTIVAITGKKQHGKDSVAQHLVTRYGYQRVAFADPLKEGLAAMLGITREELEDRKLERDDVVDRTYRFMLQTLGTEWGRETVHPDIWLNVLVRTMRRAHEKTGQARFVVSDMRFLNEAAGMRLLNGALLRVYRPGAPGPDSTWDLSTCPPQDTHASEVEMGAIAVDHTITNDGSLFDLGRAVDEVMGLLQLPERHS